MSNNTYTTLPFYVDRDESGVPVIAYDQPNDQLKVSVTGSNTISHGVFTTSAVDTSTPLPNTTCNSIRVTALHTNQKYVYVGSASQGVTNTSYGDMLRAGDSAVYNVTNAELLAIATDVSGEGISYVVTN